jgi:hypothetical protein
MAEKIKTSYHDRSHKEYVKMIFNYCDIKQQDSSSYGNFSKLLDLYMNFTSHYRNKRVHGIEKAYKDKDLLKLLIEIDLRFINKLLDFLKETYSLSPFDKPEKWGAEQGTKEKSDAMYNKLIVIKMKNKKSYTKAEAIEKLKTITKNEK